MKRLIITVLILLTACSCSKEFEAEATTTEALPEATSATVIVESDGDEESKVVVDGVCNLSWDAVSRFEVYCQESVLLRFDVTSYFLNSEGNKITTIPFIKMEDGSILYDVNLSEEEPAMSFKYKGPGLNYMNKDEAFPFFPESLVRYGKQMTAKSSVNWDLVMINLKATSMVTEVTITNETTGEVYGTYDIGMPAL